MSDRLRLLFVTNYYPPFEVGGYEQLCHDVAEALRERGHSVTVLTSDHGPGHKRAIQEQGVLRRLGLQPDYQDWMPVSLQFWLRRDSVIRSDLRCMAEAIQESDAQCAVFWNLERLPRQLAQAAEKMPGLCVVYWLAGYSPAEPDEYDEFWHERGETTPGRLSRWLLGPAARRRLSTQRIRLEMRHAAVVSQWSLEKGLAAGSLPETTTVLPNGVEAEVFYHRPRERKRGARLRVLYAGRISPDKGVHTLLRACGTLRRTYRIDVKASLAGGGEQEYLDELAQIVQEEGLGDAVSFLGRLPRDEMPRLMQCHDVLVLTSIHPEAFSRAVLEGMAAGMVVVGSLTGGTGEILVDGETGMTFRAGDSGDLAEKLAALDGDRELAKRLAREGQAIVLEHYTLAKMVDRLESFVMASRRQDQDGELAV